MKASHQAGPRLVSGNRDFRISSHPKCPELRVAPQCLRPVCVNSVVHTEHLLSSGDLGYLPGRFVHMISAWYKVSHEHFTRGIGATCLPRVLKVCLVSSRLHSLCSLSMPFPSDSCAVFSQRPGVLMNYWTQGDLGDPNTACNLKLQALLENF